MEKKSKEDMLKISMNVSLYSQLEKENKLAKAFFTLITITNNNIIYILILIII